MCSQRRQLACRLGGWEAGSGRAGAWCIRRGGDRASAQFGSPPRHPASRTAVTTWRWAGGRVTEQGGCCTHPRRRARPVPRWTKGPGSREGHCGGRGGGLPAARRPLQAWLPGLPVHAGLTFCVGQPGPSCAGPRVAAPPWACSAGGLPLHQLRGLEGRGRTGGVHVAEEELGAWDSVSSYEGPWRSGLHAPQQDFGLSLELSI